MNKEIKRYTIIAVLSALAVVINLFESFFIPPVQFGIRFGLANIVSLVAIYFVGKKDMVLINALRVIIANLLRGTIFALVFWISFGGVILSTIAIIILFQLKSSLLFTSIISAIAHSVGQVMVVVLVYNQILIASIIPLLLISSIVTGILTAFIAKLTLNRLKISL